MSEQASGRDGGTVEQELRAAWADMMQSLEEARDAGPSQNSE